MLLEELLELRIEYQTLEDTIGKLTYKMEELNHAILELQEMLRDTPALKLRISQRNLVQKKKTTLVVRKKLILKKNQMSTQPSICQERMQSMIHALKIQPLKMRTSQFLSSTFF